MSRINHNYDKLKPNYLFSDIARKVKEYQAEHPEASIIRMGIGDVTRPICEAVTRAMSEAVLEQSRQETFHGYGDEQGYAFLQDALKNYYASFGVELERDEIFVSDGAKSDLGNILDLFDASNTVLVPDPVYPVYADTNVMDGRKIVYLQANEENEFLPMPDGTAEADLIYICSPNNPTGAAYTRAQLADWVRFAREHRAVILFDAAYESFIVDSDIPHSIFELEGAKECAIEFGSFSKMAGFTGTRCGYTVVPKALVRESMGLNGMWRRRQTTKFNGVAYVVQRGAAAVFTEEGQRQIREGIAYYQENAKIITNALESCGIKYFGGRNSPYIWLKCPGGMRSWDFFDKLLTQANVVGTPGEGFGKNGEGYFRLTSFSTHELTAEAMTRLKSILH
ncbi:MAG: LL-diaminopimelate aminotransferase [Clostridia bacterium]|nr:LL-diaminopimelate aminotransferase [Clostridia bacterium]